MRWGGEAQVIHREKFSLGGFRILEFTAECRSARTAGARPIKQWEDLYRLRIGIRAGYKNHPDFDDDHRIRKYGVSTDEQNFQKLAAGRIDAVLITVETGVYLLDKLGYAGRFEAAPLQLERENPAYIVMSRQSRLVPRVAELETAIAAMVANGTVDAMRRRYLRPLIRPDGERNAEEEKPDP